MLDFLFSKITPDSDEASSISNLFLLLRIINFIKVWLYKLRNILNILKVGIWFAPMAKSRSISVNEKNGRLKKICFMLKFGMPKQHQMEFTTNLERRGELLSRNFQNWNCKSNYFSVLDTKLFFLLTLLRCFENYKDGNDMGHMKVVTLHKKLKFSIKNFFSKRHQIHRKLRIWSHLLKKSLWKTSVFVQCYVFDSPAFFSSLDAFLLG